LPKFELLLSAAKDSLKQVLSSSKEGIPFELIQSGALVSLGKPFFSGLSSV
jgi:hypothetical protein